MTEDNPRGEASDRLSQSKNYIHDKVPSVLSLDEISYAIAWTSRANPSLGITVYRFRGGTLSVTA